MAGLFGFALIWAGARWRAAPPGLTWGLMALWWAFLVLATAPGIGAPGLAAALGGDVRLWVLAGPLAAAALAYRALLLRLRARARPPVPASEAPISDAPISDAPVSPTPVSPTDAPFTPPELDRYARHLYLHDIGGPGQQRLKAARVLVVGAGGLGAPALLYLAASGVGTLGLVDDDTVDLSNLQRQIIHATARIGQPKVFSAAGALAALNPHVTLHPWNRRLDPSTAATLIAGHDIILDGSDNFDTRELLNRECARQGKPLVAGALGQWEGQLAIWDPARGAPCAACVFPSRPAPGLVPSCAEAGVAAPLPGIIGSMMAMETIKLITGAGTPLRGRLMIHDALHAETRVITTRRRADCPVCGTGASAPPDPPPDLPPASSL